MILLTDMGFSDKKNKDPVASQATIIVPSRLVFNLIILFLWTLKALIRPNYFRSSDKNLTIPSENPTATTLP